MASITLINIGTVPDDGTGDLLRVGGSIINTNFTNINTELTGLVNVYEGKITKSTGFLRWTGTAWEFKNETYSLSTHDHSGTYEPSVSKSTGYLTWNGTAWSWKNETYSLSSHDHSGTYEGAITKATGYLKWTGSAWSFVNETYSLSTHDHSGTYEPAFTKNTAFNKNFGIDSGTVCQGNDSRLSNARTPADTSVTYAKIAPDLTQIVAISASAVDWASGGVYTKTLPGNTTFTFSNLKLNKTITLILSGNYLIYLPSYCKLISGEYDGSTTNYLQFHCTNAGSGTEQVWFTISKQAT